MSDTYWRTGETHLSDDELLLLDALFDKGGYWQMLRRDDFAKRHALPHSHTLDDNALQHTLARLREDALLQAYYAPYDAPDYRQHWMLTPRGGALWQRERLPDWSRYCYATTYYDDTRALWRVESPALATAQAFAQTAHALGMGAPSPQTLQHMELPQYQMLPWKSFPQVHRLFGARGATTFDDSAAYDAALAWWRTVNELIALHRKQS